MRIGIGDQESTTEIEEPRDSSTGIVWGISILFLNRHIQKQVRISLVHDITKGLLHVRDFTNQSMILASRAKLVITI